MLRLETGGLQKGGFRLGARTAENDCGQDVVNASAGHAVDLPSARAVCVCCANCPCIIVGRGSSRTRESGSDIQVCWFQHVHTDCACVCMRGHNSVHLSVFSSVCISACTNPLQVHMHMK